jgi:hypothetical protein
MLNPLALSRGSHYLESAWRLAVLAEIAYRDDPAGSLLPFADHYRRLEVFRQAGAFGFVVGDEQNVVVALRGSDDALDWITNLKTAQIRGFGGGVHRGFVEALTLIWPQVLAQVNGLLDKGQTLWITGHSLGGAIATLLAAKFSALGIEPYITCTYGAPRVFSPKAASAYLPRLYRFVNKTDLVPTVPPPLTLPWYRYAHAGSLSVVLDKQQRQTVCLKGSDQDCFSFWRWLFTPTSELFGNVRKYVADHAMKTYIELLKAELGAEAVRRLEQGRELVKPHRARITPRRALAA